MKPRRALQAPQETFSKKTRFWQRSQQKVFMVLESADRHEGWRDLDHPQVRAV
jgi:hypothetical protein